jgi:hypothetical protein
MMSCPVVVHSVWQRPGSIALIFVNVTREPVATEVVFDGARYGLAAKELTLQRCDGTERAAEKTGNRFVQPLVIQPYSSEIWIVRSAGDDRDQGEAGQISEAMKLIRDFK